MTTDRVDILGIPVDALDLDATVDRCERLIAERRPAYQVSVNAAKLIAILDDARLRADVLGADLISADGQSIVWASRVLGRPLPGRVAGIDLMHRLLDRAAERGWRVFLLGAEPRVLDRAAARMIAGRPSLVVCGRQHGYFTDDENEGIRTEIEKARPDVLFVAMSSPRKEHWIADHARRAGVPLALGVGGAFDVVAGKTRRAPILLQRIGLEWLFRLVQEPRRLGRRYAVTNVRFVREVLRELLR